MARLSFCPPIYTASKRPGVISAVDRQMPRKSHAPPAQFNQLHQQTIFQTEPGVSRWFALSGDPRAWQKDSLLFS